MRSPKSDRIFEEIVDQIQSGEMALGARLPTHRDLAKQKKVSLSVVNRVYAKLQRSGLTEAGGRRGTVLRSKPRAGTGQADPPPSSQDAASEIIDLSHNYAALPELNKAVESLFAASMLGHCERQPADSKNEALVQHAGRRWLSLLSLPADGPSVLGCWGGQHGIQACLLAFAGLNQKIAVEPFTYTGLKLAASVLGIELVVVEADREGMRPDALERAMRRSAIKAVYLMPSFQNPFGTTMPAVRRRQLADVCAKKDLFVIEDDPHRYLTSGNIPSFIELMPERSAHVTTMSKILGPAMRLGFVATSSRLSLRLQSAIRSSNWTLPQLETSVMIAALDGLLPGSIPTLRQRARRRQEIARDILRGHEVIGSLDSPHLCVKLGRSWRSSQLSSTSIEYGFKVSAGSLYAVGGDAEANPDFIRVSLMSEPVESRLVEGLRRLRELMDGAPSAFLRTS